MGALALGVLAVVLAIAALRWFAGADPKALVKNLRWFGAGFLLLAAVGLAALDRVGLAMLVGTMAWGLFTGGRVWPGAWSYRFGPRQPSGTTAGGLSHVRTEWLDMELDHATGEMRGTVLKEPFEGPLESHSKASLGALWSRLKATDQESAQLLEAWLERRFGHEWRNSPEFTVPPSGSPSGTMSRAEALSVLGLKDGATDEEIRAAYHRLIVQNHPDHGGSSYLAAKINEARDVLVGG